MNEQLTIGRIEFERTAPRVVRVIKATKPVVNHRRTEIAMMRSLMLRYPEKAMEFVNEFMLTTAK